MLSRIALLLAPLAILVSAFRLGPQAEFLTAFLALIPLAGLLGEATEELAIHTGPKIGGLLSATLGTMTEIIIMFALLRSGQILLLKASIVGSILISLLFTVGFAILLGGIRNGRQQFDRQSVGLAATTMILAVVGLLVPTLFSFLVELQQHSPITADFSNKSIDQISVVVAVILFFLYLLTVVYQLSAPEGESLARERCVSSPGKVRWSIRGTRGADHHVGRHAGYRHDWNSSCRGNPERLGATFRRQIELELPLSRSRHFARGGLHFRDPCLRENGA